MEYHVARVMNGEGPFDDKIRICLTRISAYCAQERFEEAVCTGLFALEKMGMALFPKSPSVFTVLKELVKTKVFLRKYTLESLSRFNLSSGAIWQSFSWGGVIGLFFLNKYFSHLNYWVLYCNLKINRCIYLGFTFVIYQVLLTIIILLIEL